jgi:hypothetical protein
MLNIIITLDYELHGNGTGDVLENVIKPTNQIIRLCNKYNAKLSIMFEIAEYWAFKEAEKDGRLNKFEYSPSKVMEEQAKKAIKQGHDVQLHIHPEWIGAEYVNGFWKLNFDFKNLLLLPRGIGNIYDPLSIKGVFFKGKRDLEFMLKKVDKNYKCQAFRAGGWRIQPEKNIILAMKEVGLKVDTTVFKGGFEKSDIVDFDFRNAEKNFGYWWTKNDNLNRLGKKGENIIEMPIYTINKSILNYYRLTNLFITIKRISSRGFNPYENNYNDSKNIRYYLNNYIFNSVPIKWDFCKLSKKQMIKFLLESIKNSNYENKVTPLVMIGHSKDFYIKKNFEEFLKYVSRKFSGNNLNFSTISSTVKDIESGYTC